MTRLHATLPTVMKKYAWNLKYGLIGYPRFVAPDDIVQYTVARLRESSSVLDLGCGRGSLLRALRNKGWRGRLPMMLEKSRTSGVHGWSQILNHFGHPFIGIS
jgi:SAM-dependent methyltransferase